MLISVSSLILVQRLTCSYSVKRLLLATCLQQDRSFTHKPISITTALTSMAVRMDHHASALPIVKRRGASSIIKERLAIVRSLAEPRAIIVWLLAFAQLFTMTLAAATANQKSRIVTCKITQALLLLCNLLRIRPSFLCRRCSHGNIVSVVVLTSFKREHDCCPSKNRCRAMAGRLDKP
jgi:hypothetical protein